MSLGRSPRSLAIIDDMAAASTVERLAHRSAQKRQLLVMHHDQPDMLLFEFRNGGQRFAGVFLPVTISISRMHSFGVSRRIISIVW